MIDAPRLSASFHSSRRMFLTGFSAALPVPVFPQGGFGFGGRALNFMKKAADKLEKLSNAADTAAASAMATPGGGGGAGGAGGDGGDDDEEVKFQTVNLRLSAVKLDGDPNDRTSRELRYCFRIISPTNSLTLQAESEEERAEWVAALQGVIAELITMGPKKSLAAGATAVLTAVHQGAPGNSSCADCGEADPDWCGRTHGHAHGHGHVCTA